MSDAIVKPMPYRVDLAETIKKTYLDTIFATQDNKAHRFDIALYKDKAQQTLPSGTAVSAYFIRYGDNITIPMKGSVNGNVVSVTLSNACYNKTGQFALIIKAVTGDVISTIFYGEGTVFASSTDKFIDPEGVIPSMEELLHRIGEMEGTVSQLSQQMVDYRTTVNLLVNSNFRNPVNSKGNDEYAGGDTIDGWHLGGNPVQGVVRITDDGIVLAAGADDGAYANLTQEFDRPDMVGKPMTFAFYCKEIGLMVIPVTYGTGKMETSADGTVAIIHYDQKYFYMRVIGTTPRTFVWTALYEGTYTAETLPPYRHKEYAVELAESRMYFKRIGGKMTAFVGYGGVLSSANKQVIITIPTAGGFRSGASIRCTYAGVVRCFSEIGTSYEVSNVEYYGHDDMNVVLRVTMQEALDGGKLYLLRLDDTAYIDLSADL